MKDQGDTVRMMDRGGIVTLKVMLRVSVCVVAVARMMVVAPLTKIRRK